MSTEAEKQKKLEELDTEIKNREAILTTLKADIKSRQKLLETMKTDDPAVASKLKTQEEEILLRDKQLIVLNQKIGNLELQLKDAGGQQVKDKEAKIITLEAQLKAAETEKKELLERSQRDQIEVQKLLRILKEKEAEMKTLQDNNQNLTNELQGLKVQMQKDKEQFQAEREQFAKEKAAKDAELKKKPSDDVVGQAQTLKDENAKLRQEIENYIKLLKNTSADLMIDCEKLDGNSQRSKDGVANGPIGLTPIAEHLRARIKLIEEQLQNSMKTPGENEIKESLQKLVKDYEARLTLAEQGREVAGLKKLLADKENAPPPAAPPPQIIEKDPEILQTLSQKLWSLCELDDKKKEAIQKMKKGSNEDIEAALTECQERMQNLQVAADMHKQKLLKTKTKKKDIKAQLAAQEQKMQSLKDKADHSTQELLATQTKLAEVEAKLRVFQERHGNMDEILNKYKNLVAQSDAMFKNEKVKVDNLTKEKGELEGKLKSTTSKLEHLMAETEADSKRLAGLEALAKSQEDDLAKKELYIEKILDDSSMMKKKIASLQKRLDFIVNDQLVELNKRLEEKMTEINILKDMVKSSKTLLRVKESDLMRAKQKLSKYEDPNAGMLPRINPKPQINEDAKKVLDQRLGRRMLSVGNKKIEEAEPGVEDEFRKSEDEMPSSLADPPHVGEHSLRRENSSGMGTPREKESVQQNKTTPELPRIKPDSHMSKNIFQMGGSSEGSSLLKGNVHLSPVKVTKVKKTKAE